MLMIRTIIIFYLSLSAIALAQYVGGKDGIFNLGSGITPTPPVTCSNELDFSVACNSQYIGLL